MQPETHSVHAVSTRPKHATASVYLFSKTPDGWRIGLVRHPRFSKWMLPGGHVEDHETPAEAALREVAEETGLTGACLVDPPGIATPDGAVEPPVTSPVWIVEQQVPPEAREPHMHVHIDHLYIAFVTRADTPDGAELRFAWHSSSDLDRLHMFPDTKARARHLFRRLNDPTGHAAHSRSDAKSTRPWPRGPYNRDDVPQPQQNHQKGPRQQTGPMTLGQFTRLLYQLTIGLRHRIDDHAFLHITSDYSAGEWKYGLQLLAAAVKTSHLPLYEREHADLNLLWNHIDKDPVDLDDIPTIADGQSPWGNGVSYNYPSTSD